MEEVGVDWWGDDDYLVVEGGGFKVGEGVVEGDVEVGWVDGLEEEEFFEGGGGEGVLVDGVGVVN